MKKVLILAKQHIMLFVGLLASLSVYYYISTTRISQSALRLEISIASVVAIIAGILSFLLSMRKPANLVQGKHNWMRLLVWAGVFIFANIFLLGGGFQYVDDNVSALICVLSSLFISLIQMPFTGEGLYVNFSNLSYYILHFVVAYVSLWQMMNCARTTILLRKANSCNAKMRERKEA